MKTRLLIIIGMVIAVVVIMIFTINYLASVEPSFIDHPLVKNCKPSDIAPTILITNSTHKFDLFNCQWNIRK